MKSVFSLMLLVGLILAGIAVYIVQNYVGAYQNAYREAVMENQKARPAVETTQVYVANRDIRYGEELADEDFRLIPWPKDAVPEGVFNEENPIHVEGDERRIALRAMNTNEVILASKVTEPGAPAGLISELEVGMRGYAMSVDPLMAVGGFLRPGDRVDIYWTSTIQEYGHNEEGERIVEDEFTVTRLIETGINVIAVDHRRVETEGDDGPQSASTIVVGITPEQAASLTLAQAQGRLSVTLIGLKEEQTDAVEVTEYAFLGVDNLDFNPKAKTTCTVRTRRGVTEQVHEAPCRD